MADTTNLRERLEEKRAYLIKEAERITNLLIAIGEAEKYLESDASAIGAQASMVLTPPITGTVKPASLRIREALLRMPETFQSSDLWKEANREPGILIDKRKTFAPFFTELKNKGEVVEIQAPQGNIPGIYQKGDMERTQQMLKRSA